ncbi:PPP1R37_9 [Blepharisma stoltei]|uniref:Uncharacterized protein n=1 Tax=Blepharisma stoltei TaxID=1481888 RepID=A0AAU9KGA4_9CILI|nr:unnamed protein product [Blepharisma stoltei]
MNDTINLHWAKLENAITGTTLPVRPSTAISTPSNKILRKTLSRDAIRKTNQSNRKSFSCLNTSFPRPFTAQTTTALLNSSYFDGLSNAELSEIFRAKCEDLQISLHQEQEMKFQMFSGKSFKDRKFDMRKCCIGPSAAKKIGDLLRNSNKFYSILLAKNSIGDEGAIYLARCLSKNKSIVHIDISSNDITPGGAKVILNLLTAHPSMISFDISSHEGLHRNRLSTTASKSVAQMLKYNKLLLYLNFASTALGPFGMVNLIEGLKMNKTLLFLNLSNNNSGARPMELLAKTLVNTNLEELDISMNNITDEGIEPFANLFNGLYGAMCKLKKFDSSGNKLSFRGGGKLFRSLKSNPHLKALNIENNPLGPHISNYIKELLEANTELEYLNMSNCNLQDEGVSVITEPLGKNFSLKTLILKKNLLGNEGVQHIAFGLWRNASLTSIDLSNNKITKQGGVCLAESLQKNKTLQSLELKENDLKDGAGRELSEASRLNKSILNLSLDLNPLDYKYIKNINQNMKINRALFRSKRAPAIKSDLKRLKFVDKKSVDEIELSIDEKKKEQEDAENKLSVQKSKLEELKAKEKEKLDELIAEYQKYVEKSEELSVILNKILEEMKIFSNRAGKEMLSCKIVLDVADAELKNLENRKNALYLDFSSKRECLKTEKASLKQKIEREETGKRIAENELQDMKFKLRETKIELAKLKIQINSGETKEVSLFGQIPKNESKSKYRVKPKKKKKIQKMDTAIQEILATLQED